MLTEVHIEVEISVRVKNFTLSIRVTRLGNRVHPPRPPDLEIVILHQNSYSPKFEIRNNIAITNSYILYILIYSSPKFILYMRKRERGHSKDHPAERAASTAGQSVGQRQDLADEVTTFETERDGISRTDFVDMIR